MKRMTNMDPVNPIFVDIDGDEPREDMASSCSGNSKALTFEAACSGCPSRAGSKIVGVFYCGISGAECSENNCVSFHFYKLAKNANRRESYDC